jgi:hypothetical protein
MLRRCSIAAALLLLTVASASTAADAALFRLFLLNGETITSYGEFSRVDDRVIFSMPIGGPDSEPRLHVVSLPAGMIDWERTGRHVTSARYQRYVATRGDEDFRQLTAEVARVLGQIALTTDRQRALQVAEQARRTLADWPAAHFGYRQDEVRDVIGVLDNAIGALRGSGGTSAFSLALVATVEPVRIEPIAGMPSPKDQLDQIFRVVSMTSQAAERVSLLQAALRLLDETSVIPGVDTDALRRRAERGIREELDIDARYARLARELTTAARRAAADARVDETQKLLAEVRRRDARLGRHRPEVVLAVEATVQAQVEAARQLRLLRDRWRLRQSMFGDYQRSVRSEILQLVRARTQLEAIRQMEGPRADTLPRLQTRFAAGAARLQRLIAPTDLKPAHDLLISAMQFGEGAARIRYEAVASGNLATAREASSAAAGSLLMFDKAQQEIRTYLEPPRLP